MKNKLWIIALVAIIGFSMAACDNGGDEGGGDVYKLEWGTLNKSRTEIETLIQQQGWSVVTADNGNSAMANGYLAETIHDYCARNFTFTNSGNATGSFEELANFSKDDISPPSGLKTWFINNKADVPLVGEFDGGQAGAVFIYMTKGGNASGSGSGGSSSGKYIIITGLDDFIGASYQLGLATTEDKLDTRDLVAYAVGTISSGRQAVQLLDYKTDAPWKGSGSYYVGVILEGKVSGTLVTMSKKSFNSLETTLSTNDFSGDFAVSH